MLALLQGKSLTVIEHERRREGEIVFEGERGLFDLTYVCVNTQGLVYLTPYRNQIESLESRDYGTNHKDRAKTSE